MERKLCIKCDKCHQTMDFDYYSNKFICECNNTLSLENINNKDLFVVVDSNYDNILEPDKKLNINYKKENFTREFKNILKRKPLAPDSFSKLKKSREIDIKLVYVPIILYEAKCAICFDNKDNQHSLYKISNMIFDEYTNFSHETLNSLYPIDLYSKVEEQGVYSNSKVEKFNMNFDEIIISIQDKVKEKISNDTKLDIKSDEKYEIIFLNEKYQSVLLPIYDFVIKYKNKDYHLSMNANTGKVSVEVLVDNTKLYLITILFLIIDFVYFYLSHLIGIVEEASIVISIIIYIIQILLIWCLYFLTKGISINNNSKNKYFIKKIM